MSDNQQIDLTRPATITLPLFQWDAVLGMLRTGRGDAFFWEATNPLILAINQQLQRQMYMHQQSTMSMPQGLGGRTNGEDTSEGRAEDRAHNEGIQRRRPALWEQNRAEGEE